MRRLPLLFASGVDCCCFPAGRRRDEIADAHALWLCGFDDFLRLFWRVVREDGFSAHDAHPAAHDRLLFLHVQILAKRVLFFLWIPSPLRPSPLPSPAPSP